MKGSFFRETFRTLALVLKGVALTGIALAGGVAWAGDSPGVSPGVSLGVSPAPDASSGVWLQHKVTFNYFGFTSHYTCTGLEDQVKAILRQMGARKDAKVNADGCPYGPNSVGRAQWVAVDFFTLQPTPDGAPSSVQAHWVERGLSPRRPYFMGDGDCELIEQMRAVIANNFTLKDVKYRTDCTPHQLNINGFSVEAQTLVPLPAPNGKLANNG